MAMEQHDSGYRLPRPHERLAGAVRTRGVRPVAGAAVAWGSRYVAGRARRAAGRAPGRFAFAGRTLPYLNHPYKWTWVSERVVEVPIARAELAARPGARVLEVGNVLAHYGPVDHVVVDKYERAPGVVRDDVLDHRPAEPYDLIVSVSTLEHVGWDEPVRDEGAAVRAVEHLTGLLAPAGRLVVTCPVGYNPSFDAALRSAATPLRDLAAIRRAPGLAMRWEQVDPAAAWDAPYDFVFYVAAAVVVATFDAPA
jgi:SAM-dependent methyltransferase